MPQEDVLVLEQAAALQFHDYQSMPVSLSLGGKSEKSIDRRRVKENGRPVFKSV
jgi:sulfatase maturation enzyme AslB (radical SAM superfamily)